MAVEKQRSGPFVDRDTSAEFRETMGEAGGKIADVAMGLWTFLTDIAKNGKESVALDWAKDENGNLRPDVGAPIKVSQAAESLKGGQHKLMPTKAEPEIRPVTEGAQKTFTVELNGQWKNIPAQWVTKEGPVELDEETASHAAASYEAMTGKKFPGFASMEEAAAEAHSGAGQGDPVTGDSGRPGWLQGLVDEGGKAKKEVDAALGNKDLSKVLSDAAERVVSRALGIAAPLIENEEEAPAPVAEEAAPEFEILGSAKAAPVPTAKPQAPQKAPPKPVEKPKAPAGTTTAAMPAKRTSGLGAPPGGLAAPVGNGAATVPPIGPAKDVGYAAGMRPAHDSPTSRIAAYQTQQAKGKSGGLLGPVWTNNEAEVQKPEQDLPDDVMAMMEYSAKREAPAFRYKGQIYVADATSPGGYKAVDKLKG